MRVEDLLARLEGVRENGERSWVARCPAHDDHNPSMSVTASGGKILMHCHAGCTIEEICAGLGIQKKDLFEDDGDLRGGGRVRSQNGDGAVGVDLGAAPSPSAASARSGKKSGGHGRLVCEYVYRAPGGEALFKVQRRVLESGKKTFIAYRPDKAARGGWAFGIHDRSGGKEKLLIPFSVPYHLPQLVAAGKAGRAVLILEGEKDVATAEGLGFAATCNPFGAGKWGKDWPPNWGEWFQGVAAIFIVADRDPETVTRTVRGKEVTKEFLVGQHHAWDVAQQLKAAGVKARVRLVCLPDVKGRPVKDFTDWVQACAAEGVPCDKKAFLGAVAEFGEWPAAWRFTEEGSASARAEKGARAAASDTPGEEAPILERFGRRRAPRTPAEKNEVYEVDFRLSGQRFVRLEVSAEMRLADVAPIMCARVRRRMGDGERLTTEIAREIQVVCTVMWLRSRGRFFWDANFKSFDSSMYFDRREGVLMFLREAEFQAWLATEADINRESRTFKFILAAINDAALSPEVSQGVVPSNAWERRGDSVYISSGDANMWRVRAGAIERVQNGVDGVVFMRRRTLAPWALLDGAGVDPFATARIFTGATWADPASGPMNVRLWVLNLFAGHRMKPALLLTGAFGSGKTRMALALKQILGMCWDGLPDDRIHRMQDGDAGEESFWVTADSGKVEIFDNVDSKIKWMGDALQIALTGGSSPRRKKYSDRDTITLRANANLILTSNNPMFATEGGGGLADRLITVHLSAPADDRQSLDDELTREIERGRDGYLTWIARTLARALADDKPVDGSINRRHPEYGKFSVRCGRAFGNETGVVGALGVAEADKSLLPLMNDTVARQILRVLAANSFTLRFTAGEMSEKIVAAQGDQVDEKTATMYNPKRVGKAMSKFSRQFAALLAMDEPRILQGRTVYEVRGPRGVAAHGLLMVGLVGLMRQSAESPTERDKRESVPKRAPNPPNPPHARAGDIPSFVKGEEIEEDMETMAEMEGLL